MQILCNDNLQIEQIPNDVVVDKMIWIKKRVQNYVL
jgi:hypothetical protein